MRVCCHPHLGFSPHRSDPTEIPDKIPDKIKSKYFEIDKICKEFNVPIAAAALQFCNANDLISTMILGMDRSTQVSQNIDFLNIKIAKEFWDKLKNNNLIDERSPTPN